MKDHSRIQILRRLAWGASVAAASISLSAFSLSCARAKAPVLTHKAAVLDDVGKDDHKSFAEDFYSAGAEFGVPPELLMAYAYVQTRWYQAEPENGSGPRGEHIAIYGIMGLHNDPVFGRKLDEAAAAINRSPKDLTQDAYQNIRGAAALLRRYSGGKLSPKDPLAWAEAIRKLSGIPERKDSDILVVEVYETLRDGVSESGIEIPKQAGLVVPKFSNVAVPASPSPAPRSAGPGETVDLTGGLSGGSDFLPPGTGEGGDSSDEGDDGISAVEGTSGGGIVPIRPPQPAPNTSGGASGNATGVATGSNPNPAAPSKSPAKTKKGTPITLPKVQWDPSPNFVPGGLPHPTHIVIHVTEGGFAGALATFKSKWPDKYGPRSAHYLIRSKDGLIKQMVRDTDRAWHARCWNPTAIGIEHEGFIARPSKYFTKQMYAASARLVRWLGKKYSIPMENTRIVGHDLGDSPLIKLSGLKNCNDHNDPGKGWDWAKYFDLLGDLMPAAPPSAPANTSNPPLASNPAVNHHGAPSGAIATTPPALKGGCRTVAGVNQTVCCSTDIRAAYFTQRAKPWCPTDRLDQQKTGSCQINGKSGVIWRCEAA